MVISETIAARIFGNADRIGIGWWMFVVAGGVAIVIALITVSFQSIKAAVSNPVKSLRAE